MGVASQRFTAASRRDFDAMTQAAREGMRSRGFAEAFTPDGVGRWVAPLDGLARATLEVVVPIAPVDGGLDMSVHGGAALDGAALRAVVPAAARRFWLDDPVGPQPADDPLLKSLGSEDRPDLGDNPMVGVDAADPVGFLHDVLFRTLDDIITPGMRAISTPEGLFAWASQPRHYGRFGGMTVRSAVVELHMLGRPELAAGVASAFEVGDKARNDQRNPDAWPAFKRWADSVSADEWRRLAGA